MVSHQSISCIVLALVPTCLAQFGGYGGGSGNNGGNNNPYSGGNGNGNSGFGDFFGFDFSQAQAIVTAHAVLATVAFAFFFPVGGILIRLASFPGLWMVHGLVQIFAYAMYVAAFGLGCWMVSQRHTFLSDAHPIIGIVLLGVLFFQPFLGLLHHFCFKKYSRRVFWSYGHIWLGRAAITLGIINGGLGLRLAKRTPVNPPSRGAIIAYGVVAGFIWLLYVISIFVGEIRRRRLRTKTPPPYTKASGPQAKREQYA